MFNKTAFCAPEHEKITKAILGPRFDKTLFDQIQSYIDGPGGFNHRERHGHNKSAEDAILKQWGQIGVEMFKIHILSDWVQDDLGSVTGKLFEAHQQGLFELPYYDQVVPACKRPKVPLSVSEGNETVPDGCCGNCGSNTTIDISRWYGRRPVCRQCLEERNLEVCVQCKGLFSKTDRVDIPGESDKYVCRVCAPSYLRDWTQP
jgi:hypothetical protein